MPNDATSLASSPVNISGSLRAAPDGNFHSDYPTTPEDELAGDRLAHEMGDLFISHHADTADAQWAKVAKALRIHGFKITFPDIS